MFDLNTIVAQNAADQAKHDNPPKPKQATDADRSLDRAQCLAARMQAAEYHRCTFRSPETLTLVYDPENTPRWTRRPNAAA